MSRALIKLGYANVSSSLAGVSIVADNDAAGILTCTNCESANELSQRK
jgi:hypothetical protein